MYSAVRAIAIILFLSLLLAVAVAVLIEQGAVTPSSSPWVAIALVGLLFALPMIVLYLWAFSRSRAVQKIANSAVSLASGKYDLDFDRSSFAEVAQIGRALEELRTTIVGQKDLHQRSMEAMQEILNGMGEGLLAIDRDRRVLLANRRFAQLSGVVPVVGQPFLEVIRNTALVKAFDQALKGTPNVTRTSMDVAGEERQVEMRIFPLERPGEIAAVALLIDISRIVRLENMRRDFLADFSHEVRTPLAGLRAAMETLETRKVEPEQEQQLKRIISRQLDRLERLLDDIRQLNQIEAGEVVLHKQKIDLKQLLEDLCDDFSEQLDGSAPKLRIAGTSSQNLVDPTRLQQVFANLIDNAFKHARGATEIRVEVEDRSDASIGRVIDDGEGIPFEEQERIFHRFYRTDPSRSQNKPGTGLGLAIAKHLVLLHGGSITVQSRPGSGAAFEVRLPKSSQ